VEPERLTELLTRSEGGSEGGADILIIFLQKSKGIPPLRVFSLKANMMIVLPMIV